MRSSCAHPRKRARPFRRCVALGALSLGLVAGGGSSQETTLLDAVQAHYDAVADFQGDFTQTSYIASLGEESELRGQVAVKRPGRLRWSYAPPDGRVILLDPTSLRIYSPAERQLQVMPLDGGALSPTALSFLMGDARLADAFKAEVLDPGTRAERGLALVPRGDQGVERLELWVDAATYQLRESLVVDLVGNRTRLRFQSVRENTGIADALFDIDVPEGTEVIDLR